MFIIKHSNYATTAAGIQILVAFLMIRKFLYLVFKNTRLVAYFGIVPREQDISAKCFYNVSVSVFRKHSENFFGYF